MSSYDPKADASSYPEAGYALLAVMHERHFWYCGRRRFVLAALRRELAYQGEGKKPLDVADLGGGNGNGLTYVSRYGDENTRVQKRETCDAF